MFNAHYISIWAITYVLIRRSLLHATSLIFVSKVE